MLWPSPETEPREKDAGLSTAELLVVMIISSVMMIAGATIMLSSIRATRTVTSKTNTSSSARIAMEALTRDVRVSVTPPRETSPFVAAGANELVFYASKSPTPSAKEPYPTKIWYRYDPSSECLRRTQVTPVQVGGVATLDASGRMIWPAMAVNSGACVVRGEMNRNAAGNGPGTALFSYQTTGQPNSTLPLTGFAASPAGGFSALTTQAASTVRFVSISAEARDPINSNLRQVPPTRVTETVSLINQIQGGRP